MLEVNVIYSSHVPYFSGQERSIKAERVHIVNNYEESSIVFEFEGNLSDKIVLDDIDDIEIIQYEEPDYVDNEFGMKNIQLVYPSEDGGFPYYISNYNPLLESMGFGTVLQVDDHDYQGDSRVLFRNGNRYGMLIFGWGSCSGCDALQACQSYKDVEDLRIRLFQKIHWEDSALDMMNYLVEKDWELEWSWRNDNTKEFVQSAIIALGDIILGL